MGIAPLPERIAVPLRLAPDERERYEKARAEFVAAYAAYARTTPAATWLGFVRGAARTPTGRRALAAWRAAREILAYPADKQRALRELVGRHVGERVLIYVADNQTAYAVARELLVHPITSEIGRAERTAALARFGTGAAAALVSAGGFPSALVADIAIVVGGARRVQPRVRRIYELAIADSTEADQARRRDRGPSGRAAHPADEPRPGGGSEVSELSDVSDASDVSDVSDVSDLSEVSEVSEVSDDRDSRPSALETHADDDDARPPPEPAATRERRGRAREASERAPWRGTLSLPFAPGDSAWNLASVAWPTTTRTELLP